MGMTIRPAAVIRSPAAWAAAAAVATLAALVAGARNEVWSYLGFSAIVLAAGAILIPRAVKRDGWISSDFLLLALLVRLGACLVYYKLYLAHSPDFLFYELRGNQIADAIRAGAPEQLVHSHFDVPLAEYFAGIIYLFTEPTVQGPAALSAGMSVLGSWFFFRAFRLWFPQGNARLYALLVFFLPTMVFWPGTLGKEGMMMLFLGLATYGLALLLRGNLARGALWSVLGTAGAMAGRPPLAFALAAAALVAVVSSRVPRRLPALVVVSGLLAATGFVTADWAQAASPRNVFQVQLEGLQGGPSSLRTTNFDPPYPFTPIGLPSAIVSVTFRPFPWEMKDVIDIRELPSVAESLFVFGLLVVRRREIWRGLKQWRTNPMVVLAVTAFLATALVLSPVGNFVGLSRLRIQMLPFLFMLPAFVKPGAGTDTAAETATAGGRGGS